MSGENRSNLESVDEYIMKDFKVTDRDRIEALCRWGTNAEIRKLGNWAKDLLKAGKSRQATRIIRIAEKMQKASKNEMVIIYNVGTVGIRAGGHND